MAPAILSADEQEAVKKAAGAKKLGRPKNSDGSKYDAQGLRAMEALCGVANAQQKRAIALQTIEKQIEAEGGDLPKKLRMPAERALDSLVERGEVLEVQEGWYTVNVPQRAPFFDDLDE